MGNLPAGAHQYSGRSPNEYILNKTLHIAREREYETGTILLKGTNEEIAWSIYIFSNGDVFLSSKLDQNTMGNMKGWVIQSDDMKVQIEGNMKPTGRYKIQIFEKDIGNERQSNPVLKAFMSVEQDNTSKDMGCYDVV